MRLERPPNRAVPCGRCRALARGRAPREPAPSGLTTRQGHPPTGPQHTRQRPQAASPVQRNDISANSRIIARKPGPRGGCAIFQTPRSKGLGVEGSGTDLARSWNVFWHRSATVQVRGGVGGSTVLGRSEGSVGCSGTVHGAWGFNGARRLRHMLASGLLAASPRELFATRAPRLIAEARATYCAQCGSITSAGRARDYRLQTQDHAAVCEAAGMATNRGPLRCRPRRVLWPPRSGDGLVGLPPPFLLG